MSTPIEELTALVDALRAETTEQSITPERMGALLQRMIDVLPSVIAANSLKGWVAISSINELPSNPSPTQRALAYLLDTTLYVYVGSGGDTLDGKYRSAELKGTKGDTGNPGKDGVDLGLVNIVDDLESGTSTDVLSGRMGKELKGLINSQLITAPNVDLEIGDEDGYVLARFADGEIETKNFNSATTPKSDTTPEIDIADEGDFELSDGNGKVLMRLENGHIKVKNFDSEEIEISNPMLDKFKGLKLGIIGDSISTYNGWLPSSISGYDGSKYVTYYPSGDVNAVSKTWWYKAAEMLGLNPSTDINNCAWSGCQLSGDSTSTSSASVGCSTRRVTDLAARGFTPDIILVFISCNDWRNNVAVGTWAVTDAVPAEGTITTMRAAYALLLNKIHTTYPSARVFCCTNLDDPRRDATQGYPSNNGNGVTTSQWNDNIKEIAEAFGCDVINMHNCGLTYQNMASFATDGGTHPNAAGMAMMARKVASELIAKY